MLTNTVTKRQTDGRALAYSEREREFTFAREREFTFANKIHNVLPMRRSRTFARPGKPRLVTTQRVETLR